MPWVRFDLERGRVEETEREVFLRGQKLDPGGNTPLEQEIAIFVGTGTSTSVIVYKNKNIKR